MSLDVLKIQGCTNTPNGLDSFQAVFKCPNRENCDFRIMFCMILPNYRLTGFDFQDLLHL